MSFIHNLLAFSTVFVWSANAVIIKACLAHMPSYIFNFGRFLLILPLAYFFKRPLQWSQLILIGLLINVSNFTFIGLALETEMGAGLSTVLNQTTTFFVLISSFFINKDRPKRNETLGMMIAFLGVALVAATQSSFNGSFKGILYILLAAFSSGLGMTLMYKFEIQPSLSHTVWLGAVSFLPFAFLARLHHTPVEILAYFTAASLQTWIALIFAAFIASLLAIKWWLYLLKFYPPSKVSGYLFLVSPLACLLSAICLGEKFTKIQLIAIVLVFIGVILSQRKFSDSLKNKKILWRPLKPKESTYGSR
jgi:O-acetylserine/cysteine efflux transporter